MQQSLFDASERATVKAYVGQTRSRELVKRLEAAGIGECTTRGQLPPRRRASWFYDNGAFEDFQAKREFDGFTFSRDMRRIALWCEGGTPKSNGTIGAKLTRPDFVVVPDIVAGGEASLAFSLEWLEESRKAGAPCYLAVQNGMSLERVRAFVLEHGFDGIFVGGSLDWKLETAGDWQQLGEELGLPVHVGRVGTADRVTWARELGVASIDSSFPLWTSEHMSAFLEALATEVAA
jgi:hypothetical protein